MGVLPESTLPPAQRLCRTHIKPVHRPAPAAVLCGPAAATSAAANQRRRQVHCRRPPVAQPRRQARNERRYNAQPPVHTVPYEPPHSGDVPQIRCSLGWLKQGQRGIVRVRCWPVPPCARCSTPPWRQAVAALMHRFDPANLQRLCRPQGQLTSWWRGDSRGG